MLFVFVVAVVVAVLAAAADVVAVAVVILMLLFDYIFSGCIFFLSRAQEEGSVSSLCLLPACCFIDHASCFQAVAGM